MPNEIEVSGNLFIAALEDWERPFASPERGIGKLSEAAVAARFIRGLENWERPMLDPAIQEITLPEADGITALTRVLSLKVKSPLSVIARRAAAAWAGVAVMIERLGAGIVRAATLDAFGRADFAEMLPGQYRLIVSPLSGSMGSYGALLVGAKAGEDVLGARGVEQSFLRSELHALATLLPGGEVSLTFNTEDARLAEGIVRFAFTERESGRVQLSGSVRLSLMRGVANHWGGRWQYHLTIAQNCELLFSVESK